MRTSLLRGLLCSPLLLALAAAAGLAQGQTHYVYTNDDNSVPSKQASKGTDPSQVVVTTNTVSGFAVNADGSLTELANSPFATGGNGNGGTFFGTTRVATLIVGNFLYATNAGSGDVSGFEIDPTTGDLTPVAGSPFLVESPTNNLGLAPTPDGKFLIVAADDGLHVYAIDANGSLSEISGSPFVPSGGNTPDDLRVTPDGKYLAVTLPFVPAVDMFAVGADGTLTAVPGTPFPATTPASPAGLDINCASDHLYAGTFRGEPANDTVIEGYSIAADGSLTPLPGSPYPTQNSDDVDTVRLSVDEQYLFASNIECESNATSISTYAVAPDGSLSEIAGSPFPNPGASNCNPVGLAVDANGQFLFAANLDNTVSSFVIATDGTLTPAPGSPYPTGQQNGSLLSIAAYPPKSCAAFQSTVTIDCSGNTTVAPTFLVGCTPSAQLSYATPTATTDCPGGNVTVVCEPASGSVFPQGTTTVTCTATDDCGGSAMCSFDVVVSDPFAVPGGAVCLVGDTTGDTFSEVVAPGPLRGYWVYHVAATGETICGIANKVSYTANRSLISSDNNYSSENPFYYMDANVNFGTHSGTVVVSKKGTSRKYTLRDRDTRNDPGCAASGGGGTGRH